jgi:hypothetical protein
MDQTLTDVNTEFAEYRLFVCKKESKLVHEDVLSSSFTGRCPSDGSKLVEIDGIPKVCPACNQPITVDIIKPLAADSTAE